MIIIPAIDLMSGQVVRLTRGQPKDKKVYSASPADVVKDFTAQDASLLHIVDLDAALDQGNNFEIIVQIIKEAGVDIQVGGGIRTIEYARKLIDCGAKRIVVSTKALLDKEFSKALLNLFPEQLALSLDIKDGRPAIKGWKDTVVVNIENFLEYLQRIGLRWLIYTDISRDGTLAGVNYKGIKDIKDKVAINLITSGGISSLNDIKRIESLGVWGVIVGKAFYEGKFTLKQAIEVLS